MEGQFKTITGITTDEVDNQLNELLKDNFVKVLGIAIGAKSYRAMIYIKPRTTKA